MPSPTDVTNGLRVNPMSGPLVTVRCFSHVGMTVSDLDASVDFYTRVLGFARLFEDVEEGWTRIGLGIGDIQLELFSPKPSTASGDPVDPFYPAHLGRPKIALTVVDVERTYERLVAAGVTPLCPIVTTSVSKFFFIADPDSTPVQLHEFLGGEQRVTELFRTAHTSASPQGKDE
jgi:catechol 2,3-dioxygenase-like lactoylglutathione lyase family enzyme